MPQGRPQDTTPTSTLLTTSGPPESPWQAPSPDLVKVQICVEKMGLGDWAEEHAVLVMVESCKNWRLLGVLPPFTRVPHPLNTADTAPPTELELMGMLETKVDDAMLDAVLMRLMSFSMVDEE